LFHFGGCRNSIPVPASRAAQFPYISINPGGDPRSINPLLPHSTWPPESTTSHCLTSPLHPRDMVLAFYYLENLLPKKEPSETSQCKRISDAPVAGGRGTGGRGRWLPGSWEGRGELAECGPHASTFILIHASTKLLSGSKHQPHITGQKTLPYNNHVCQCLFRCASNSSTQLCQSVGRSGTKQL
jgi:hypothetical protein